MECLGNMLRWLGMFLQYLSCSLEDGSDVRSFIQKLQEKYVHEIKIWLYFRGMQEGLKSMTIQISKVCCKLDIVGINDIRDCIGYKFFWGPYNNLLISQDLRYGYPWFFGIEKHWIEINTPNKIYYYPYSGLWEIMFLSDL